MKMDPGLWSLVCFFGLMWLTRAISSEIFDRFGAKAGIWTMIGLSLIVMVLMLWLNVANGIMQWDDFLPPSWAAYLTSSGW